MPNRDDLDCPSLIVSADGPMDRSAAVIFSDQLREAREDALRDSEAYEGIIHVVERLGSYLYGKIAYLGAYKDDIEKRPVIRL